MGCDSEVSAVLVVVPVGPCRTEVILLDRYKSACLYTIVLLGCTSGCVYAWVVFLCNYMIALLCVVYECAQCSCVPAVCYFVWL